MRERVALQFAEKLITDPSSVSDAAFEELKRHFSEGEIVELCFFVGFYNLLHRFNAAIDLEPIAGEAIVVRHLADFQLA